MPNDDEMQWAENWRREALPFLDAAIDALHEAELLTPISVERAKLRRATKEAKAARKETTDQLEAIARSRLRQAAA